MSLTKRKADATVAARASAAEEHAARVLTEQVRYHFNPDARDVLPATFRIVWNGLSERERQMLNRRLGLFGVGKRPLAPIAHEFTVSPSRVTQITKAAMRKFLGAGSG